MSELQTAREHAVHLLRAGQTTTDVAAALHRSESWVRKCWRRYQHTGWAGLSDVSRAPHQHGTRLADDVRASIIQARSELEAAAATGTGLKYIGARAVRTHLKASQLDPLPSVSTIERVMREAGMLRAKAAPPTVTYPRLCPQQPHTLIQIDQMPHFLHGGQRVFCFNGIDVVSRYPTGQVYLHRRASDAVAFLIHVMQIIGIATYTQVDNEGCFSGGSTHPYVLGQCARLALHLGTELVFSPVYHPQSNGCIERFHQEYQRHVWQDTYLTDADAVQAQADRFFAHHRASGHHAALAGHTPHDLHHRTPPRLLAAAHPVPTARVPVSAGRLHFMRCIQPDGTVSVLNVDWQVPGYDPGHGVWVTVTLHPDGSTLTVYDAAPDASDRQCLVTYPFPVKDGVVPKPTPLPLAPPAAMVLDVNDLVFAPLRIGFTAMLSLWRQYLPDEHAS